MLNRRQAVKLLGLTSASTLISFKGNAIPSPKPTVEKFGYCLNMATLRGHKLGFVKELEVASKAGFTLVEIWIDSLQEFLAKGGKVSEANKHLQGFGITAANAIGFAKWIVDDDEVRKQGVEQMKKEMDLLAQIGCKRVAAPPVGATDKPGLDLRKAGERYRTILELGDQSGVVPHLELWGFSKNLCTTSEVMFVALQSGHPSARILLDVYHLYKGGSSIETLPLIAKKAVEVIHVNDYPAKPTDTIVDSDRVHPGDGIAPVKRILDILNDPQKPLIISEEVFNAAYYKQDPLTVAKTAMQKMKKITGE
ncbi:sugar phosphate isomerase/epimerase family protein [Flavitalea sp.]|nr:sugar phosphate isomerase/epimerase family protein [Flavitalea sp.]